MLFNVSKQGVMTS